MEFEWNEAKCLANIAKHGTDFTIAETVFGDPHVIGSGKSTNGEPRWLATGTISDVYVTMVFTRRGDIIRIISIRRARDEERRRHREVFGH